MIKKLGIPKEVKQDEGRVALIPEHITQFTGLADIFVETQAGVGSGFTDEDYKQAGAKIVSSSEELFWCALQKCTVVRRHHHHDVSPKSLCILCSFYCNLRSIMADSNDHRYSPRDMLDT